MNEHMPLQNNFKKKQRKAVLKLVALFLVVVTLLSTSAWAWFRADDQLNATTGKIQLEMITIDSDLEMSIKVRDEYLPFRSSFDILRDTDLLKDLDMVPVTGLGYRLASNNEVFLYVPAFTYEENGTAIVQQSGEWSEAVANEEYISLEVKFRTKTPSTIYLAEGTEVLMQSEVESKDFVNEDPDKVGNISRYGNFSRDLIVGALRMSVAYPEETLRCLWIPRPEFTLKKGSDGKYSLTTQTVTNYWSGSHPYYDYDTGRTSKSQSGCAQTANAFTAKREGGVTPNESSIVGTTVKESNGDYYVCTAFFKIWVDGCDEEAVRALSRGKFKITLNFVAVENQG